MPEGMVEARYCQWRNPGDKDEEEDGQRARRSSRRTTGLPNGAIRLGSVYYRGRGRGEGDHLHSTPLGSCDHWPSPSSILMKTTRVTNNKNSCIELDSRLELTCRETRKDSSTNESLTGYDILVF